MDEFNNVNLENDTASEPVNAEFESVGSTDNTSTESTDYTNLNENADNAVESANQIEQNYGQVYDSQPVQGGEKKGNGMAIAALVLGIVSIVVGCCCTPVGFICGGIAVVLGILVKKNGTGNQSQALAGIICGAIGVVGSIINAIVGAAMGSSFMEGFEEGLNGAIQLFIK